MKRKYHNEKCLYYKNEFIEVKRESEFKIWRTCETDSTPHIIIVYRGNKQPNGVIFSISFFHYYFRNFKIY